MQRGRGSGVQKTVAYLEQTKQQPQSGGVAIIDRRDSDQLHATVSQSTRALRPRKLPAASDSSRVNQDEQVSELLSDNELRRKNETLALKLVSLANEVLDIKIGDQGGLDEHVIQLARNVVPDIIRPATDHSGGPGSALETSAVSESGASAPESSTIIGNTSRLMNLPQKMFLSMTKSVQLSVQPVSDLPNNAVNVGDAVVFWEKDHSDRDVERFGAVHDMTCTATGHVRIHLTRLYTRAEVQLCFQTFSKPVPEEVGTLFDTEEAAVMNDKKVTVVLRTNADVVISRDSVKQTFTLLHTSRMYENAAGDGTKSSDGAMRFSNVVLYTGFLDTKKWTVHTVSMHHTFMNTILRCVFARIKMLPAEVLQSMLQPIRMHVFNSVRNLGARSDPKESKLTIAVSFHLFSYIIGGKGLDIRWIDTTRSWQATFVDPGQFASVLGDNWNCVCKADASGYVLVEDIVYLTYSHKNPGKMEMLLTKVKLQGPAGNAAVVIRSDPDQQADHDEVIFRPDRF